MYIPVPSSNPDILLKRGTMARYQWQYYTRPARPAPPRPAACGPEWRCAGATRRLPRGGRRPACAAPAGCHCGRPAPWAGRPGICWESCARSIRRRSPGSAVSRPACRPAPGPGRAGTRDRGPRGTEWQPAAAFLRAGAPARGRTGSIPGWLDSGETRTRARTSRDGGRGPRWRIAPLEA